MTRGDIGTNMQTALEADSMLLIPLVFMDFDGDPTYVWGGLENLSWNGQTWIPVANLGNIGSISESSDGSVQSLALILNGLPGTSLTHALDLKYLNRTAQVYIAAFDSNLDIIDDAALFFAGPMSSMVPAEAIGEASISIMIESREAAMRVAPIRWRTNTDHQRDFSGDLFFNYVEDMANKTVYWGQKDPNPAPRSGGFGGFGGGGAFGGGFRF